MIALAEAQARVLQLAKPVPEETVALLAGLNRFAAHDTRAERTQPATTISAMDGYAVNAANPHVTAWTVIGESAAGAPFDGTVRQGEAVRIFTGAVLPTDANCVIIQENAERNGEQIRLTSDVAPRAGDNIRAQGSDFARGDLVVAAGTQITAPTIGLLAASGHATVTVRRDVRLALVSAGNELVPVGSADRPSALPASNAIMLAALINDLPAVVDDLGIVRDEPDALTAALKRASHADIIVTIGGASVGDYDLVQPILVQLGAKIDFWKVAVRPGKPLIAGTLGRQVVLGLPGNPVSAYVTALLFLRPLIAHLAGSRAALPRLTRHRLAAPLPKNGPRTDHIRAAFRDGAIMPLKSQDSAGLRALAAAEALIVRLPDAPPAAVSDVVDVILL